VPAYLSLCLFLLVCLAPGQLSAQSAVENAEARVYFEEGNRLYEQASDARGPRREALLKRSLEAYVDSLRIVRSRNALFNAAVVLSELGRSAEAFNYYTEYLAVEGLSEEEAREAAARRDALRPEVAILEIVSDPPAAQLWVDRRDLAPLGQTPTEIAVVPGAHRVFLEKKGFVSEERNLDVARGEAAALDVPLEPVTPKSSVEVLPEPVPSPEAEGRPRLRNAAIGTAASTLATAAVGLGLSLRARSLRDDYDAAAAQYEQSGDPDDLARARALADRTDRFNIAADVMWGTTVALGISAIVLYSQHRKRTRRKNADVAISISPRGGFASVTVPLGAVR